MTYYIAFGRALCTSIFNSDYKGAAECIAYSDGFILEWNNKTDDLEELLDSAIKNTHYEIIKKRQVESIERHM